MKDRYFHCSSFVFSMLIFSNLAVSNGFLADFCPLRNGSVLAASMSILFYSILFVQVDSLFVRNLLIG